MPGCNDAYIDNTTYVGEQPDSHGVRTARETWTVIACAHEIPVTVEFTPNATGATISAHV